MSDAPVGIIGAGPAGLAVGAALRARGLPFEIVDAGRGPGGIWDIDRAETPMYESAHFISSRSLSELPDHPFPDAEADYPRHDRILAYVRAFARRHDLERHSTFDVAVERAEREAGGGWSVELSDGTTRRFRALCAATGTTWHPIVPDVPGTFEGEAYHAFDYRSAESFRGKRVLVVGGGNSGADIACDAARSADRAWISVRRGYHFVPKYVLGKPADVFADGGPPLPSWIERPLFGALLRVLVGDLTRFGLPKPDHAVLESHPIMNTRLLDHLGHGDIAVRPDVAELRGRTVRFVDGSEDEVDVIVWATGYDHAFPFLAEADLDREQGALDLHLLLAHRRYPDLFFPGVFSTDGGHYPLVGLQARLIAAVLGDLPGPVREAWNDRRRHARVDLRGGRRYLDSPRHAWYAHSRTYRRRLEAELRLVGG